MHIRTSILLIILFILTACGNNSAENSTPETGCPQKIVSISLASDEILLDIIEDGRLIGITYLAGNRKLSNVYDKAGSVPNKLRPNLEQVLELVPDMVIVADYVDFSFINQVEKSGINTHFLSKLTSIEAIRSSIDSLGTAVCEKEKTDELISGMDQRIRKVKNRNLENNPTVLYLFPSFFTSGKNTTINDLITTAGGVNIGALAGINGNKKISKEYILNSDPDIIIVGSYSPGEEDFINTLKSDKVLSSLKAVRKGDIYSIETKRLTTVSHYIAGGVEELAVIIDSYNKKLNEDKTKTDG